MVPVHKRQPLLSPRAGMLVGGATLFLAAAAALIAGMGAERRELLEIARELRIEGPALERLDRAIAQSGGGERGRLALARALLAAELDPATAAGSRSGGGGSGEGRAGSDDALGPRRLETARTLAEGVLAAHPASWRAATTAGTATYLAWSRNRDPRLVREYRRWEEPLVLAHRLAPARDEPVRALVTAYVELWPVLSAEKRNRTRELVARALRHRPTFDHLLEPWLAVAGSGTEALAAIPDRPWAWDRLAASLARRNDWEGTCRAWERQRDALEGELERRLAEGLRLLSRGQALAARGELFGLVADAPPDHRYAGVVERALEAVPPGPGPTPLSSALRGWLRWALAARDDPGRTKAPLSDHALARLRSAAFPHGTESSDLSLAARAALAVDTRRADRLARAERIERAADALWTTDWGRYYLDKAVAAAAEGLADEARAALDRVHPDLREDPLFWLAVREVAGTDTSAQAARAGDALDRLARRSWPGTAWSVAGPHPSLRLLTAERASGLRIEVAEAPPTGAAVILALDGSDRACRAIGPDSGQRAASRSEIHLEVPLEAGLHRIELRTLAARDGARVWPGPVDLLEPGPEPATP